LIQIHTYRYFLITLILGTLFSVCIQAQPGTTTEAEVNKQKVFIEANKQKLLENFEEASVLFKEVLKNDPRNHAAAYELARVYDVLDNDEKSLNSIKVAVSLDPTNMWYKLFLADVLEKTLKYAEAADIYKEMVQKNPDTEYHYYQLAFYQVKGEKIDDAIDTYDLIEKKFGSNVEITRKKHALYLGQGDTKNATKELEQLVKKFPENISYLHLLAGFYKQQNKEANAKEVYKKILALDPTNAKATIAIESNKQESGDDANFLKSLEAVFQDKNETIEAKAFSIYGDLLYHANQPDEALIQYEETLNLNKSVFTVWEQMMYIYAEQYEMQKLADLSEKGMDIFPNQVMLYYFNGIAQGELENHKDALSSLNQAVIMSGKKKVLKIDALCRMVKPLIATGKLDKAQDKVTKALSLDPENFRSISAQAFIYAQSKETAKAEELYQSSMNKGGQNNPEVLEDYGDFLKEQGNLAKANEYWEKAQQAGGLSTRLKNKIANKGL